ncbi:hypothetical protein ACSQ67_013953 [Phaseolus vulgaris]
MITPVIQLKNIAEVAEISDGSFLLLRESKAVLRMTPLCIPLTSEASISGATGIGNLQRESPPFPAIFTNPAE